MLAVGLAALPLTGCMEFFRPRSQPPGVAGPPPEGPRMPPEIHRDPPVTPPPSPLPEDLARGKYPTALPVPGREGLVFSPYNRKPVDVQGIPSGKLVGDPHYPAEERKYFRVP